MAPKTSPLIAIFAVLSLLPFTAPASEILQEAEILAPPPPPTTPPVIGACPMNSLRLSVCANLLGGQVGLIVGRQDRQCCSVLGGLVAVDAASCLCTALKLNVLGISVNIPVDVSVALSSCGMTMPAGYLCA